jgi:ribosomal protein S18 acetylase RimI-like enzyme
MAIFTSVSRLAVYYRRHGLTATVRRTFLALKRALFSGHALVFYCDLSRLAPASELPKLLKVLRKRSLNEIDPEDFQQIMSVWNPELARQRMEERFARGASLWMIKVENRLAGYGWTLQGSAIAPYYFPLAAGDVQFFDFHVFPKYRGRAIDWFLMTYVLRELSANGAARAFAEAGEWNQASLASISTTSFQRLGRVRRVTIFGRNIVSWDEGVAELEKKNTRHKTQSLAAPQSTSSDVHWANK